MKKNMINLFTIFILIVNLNIYSQSQQNLNTTEEYNRIHDRINKLEIKINFLDEKYEHSIELSSKSIDHISNIISTSSFVLGILILILTVFITVIYNKTNQLIKKSSKHINEIKIIDNDIKFNMSEIYKKIRNEEIEYIINRLTKVPEDIVHYSSKLLSTQIEQKYFESFKNISITYDTKPFKTHRERSGEYLIVLFQHFPSQCLFDEYLSKKIEQLIPKLIDNSFENDLLFMIEQVTREYTRRGIIADEKLILIFQGIENSFFIDHTEIYKIIKEIYGEKFNDLLIYLNNTEGLKKFKNNINGV
ncbi:hypothetical protein [Leptospira meyeri]|uniref:hypothetical protein n=1 Tax=Leptospira meyeri TaxID=29508 RepID=UPI00223DE420|nr:hypothetical protein [Leptospira meyeri]MCW7490524.1 hypothetical protein [Leptospira meyeri]